ncbi:MAG: methyltransferase domain-containing protein [Actinomycetota bacterium]|nr:methyltransferase domain-containing protein [Actinomycetota bacterium]
MRESAMRRALAKTRWMLRNTFYLLYGFRGTAPINPGYGSHLGTTIDRYYERRFLCENGSYIRGTVLEVGDRNSTDLYGSKVTSVDVLDVAAKPGVDIVADLASCPQIESDTYDCVLLTQVLHVIYDMESVVAEVHRILKPGGSVVCTMAGIAQVNRGALEDYGDRWRLTSLSASELFATSFRPDHIQVRTYGNAHSACCFMQGIPAERVNRTRIDRWEPDYQLMVAVIATKTGA